LVLSWLFAFTHKVGLDNVMNGTGLSSGGAVKALPLKTIKS
jgi:hypothetical protein